ncbi:hypothetical protein QOT17_006625 [Balamuthia mandrillaris]
MDSQASKTEVEQKIKEVKQMIQEVEEIVQRTRLEQKIRAELDEHLRSAATALLSSLMQQQVKLHALLNTLAERLQEHEFREKLSELTERVSRLASLTAPAELEVMTLHRKFSYSLRRSNGRLHKAYVDKRA